jgi:hypothetical protein
VSATARHRFELRVVGVKQFDHDLALARWQDLLLGNGHEEASGRTLLRDSEAGFA